MCLFGLWLDLLWLDLAAVVSVLVVATLKAVIYLVCACVPYVEPGMIYGVFSSVVVFDRLICFSRGKEVPLLRTASRAPSFGSSAPIFFARHSPDPRSWRRSKKVCARRCLPAAAILINFFASHESRATRNISPTNGKSLQKCFSFSGPSSCTGGITHRRPASPRFIYVRQYCSTEGSLYCIVIPFSSVDTNADRDAGMISPSVHTSTRGDGINESTAHTTSSSGREHDGGQKKSSNNGNRYGALFRRHHHGSLRH